MIVTIVMSKMVQMTLLLPIEQVNNTTSGVLRVSSGELAYKNYIILLASGYLFRPLHRKQVLSITQFTARARYNTIGNTCENVCI